MLWLNGPQYTLSDWYQTALEWVITGGELQYFLWSQGGAGELNMGPNMKKNPKKLPNNLHFFLPKKFKYSFSYPNLKYQFLKIHEIFNA